MKRKPLLIRLVGGLVGFLVVLELLYVLAANWALANFGDALKGDFGSVTWESGTTWIPGQASITGLDIDIQRPPTRLRAKVEQTDVGVNLLKLFERTVDVRHVAVDGVDLALLEMTPPENPPAPSGWAIELDAADATVDRLEILGWTVSGGQGVLSASAHVDLGGEVRVGGIQLDWDGATLADASATLVEDVQVHFEGGLTEEPQAGAASAIEGIEGSIGLKGTAKTLAPFRAMLAKATWLEGLDGAGALSADVALKGGELAEGGTVSVTATDLRLQGLDFDVGGSGEVKAEVLADAMQLGLAFSKVDAKRGGKTMLVGTDLAFTASVPGRSVVAPPGDVTVDLDVPSLAVPEIAVLNTLLPSVEQFRFTGGTATVTAKGHASTADGDVTGELTLNAPGLAGQYVHLGFTTDLVASARIDGGDLSKKSLDLAEASLQFKKTRFQDGDETIRWQAKLSATQGRMVLGTPVAVDVRADVHLTNIQPVFAFFGQEKKLLDNLGRFVQVTDIEATARIALVDGLFQVNKAELTSDKFQAAADLRLGDSKFDGLMWARVGIFGLGVERTPDKTRVSVIGARRWYDNKRPEFLEAHRFKGLGPFAGNEVAEAP